MAVKRKRIPRYRKVQVNGYEYYRTDVEGADGKYISLYGKTREELYDKEMAALEQIDNTTFRRKSPTVAEYCEKWLLMQSVHIRATTLIDYTLGIVATSMGRLMGTSSPIWYAVLGVLMVLMALQTWEIFNFIPSVNLISKNKRRGFFGAFLAGILGGIFSSPCSTPVLIALLAIVAGEGNLLWGILLMLLYSVGHSALVIVAGTSIGFVQKINASGNYKTVASVSKIIMGALILLIGFYMFWLAF